LSRKGAAGTLHPASARQLAIRRNACFVSLARLSCAVLRRGEAVMSMTANFIANHKKILAAGPCMLIKEHDSPRPNVAHKFTNIGGSGFFSQGGTTSFYGINIAPVTGQAMGSMSTHGVAGGMEGIRLVHANADQGVRYLDYFDKDVTSMPMDDGARLMLTGPLEGCFIAIGWCGTQPVVFHANDNSTAAGTTQNFNNKTSWIRQASVAYFGCKLTHLMIDKDYKEGDFPYRGFVYGVKQGGAWGFWFHSTYLDGNRWKVRNASDPLPEW
jgi:hypothetical protein